MDNKMIVNQKAKEAYKKKVLANPDVRKILNEKSKDSYHKNKDKNNEVKKPRGRPKKSVDKPLEKKKVGRPIKISSG